jgi:cyclase
VLIDGFYVLKTIGFDERRNLGSPITVLRTYNTRNVDELIILDIDASRRGEPIDHFIIREISEECFMPLTVGGGVKSCDDIALLLANGADKVSINSSIITQPGFLKEAVSHFGRQCIVASLDIITIDDQQYIYHKGAPLTDYSVQDWLMQVKEEGAGEVLITSVNNDGNQNGLCIDIVSKLATEINAPVIINGGAKDPEDVAQVLECKEIDAVGASSIFHFTNYTPNDCRLAAAKRGIPVRASVV